MCWRPPSIFLICEFACTIVDLLYRIWSTEYHRTHLRRTHFLVVRCWMVHHSVMDVNTLQLLRNLIFQPQWHAGTFCFFFYPKKKSELSLWEGCLIILIRGQNSFFKAVYRTLVMRIGMYSTVRFEPLNFDHFDLFFSINREVFKCAASLLSHVLEFVVLWFLYQKFKLRLQDMQV